MKLIGISGSLRKDSYNTRLLEVASRLVGPEATLDIAGIADIPFYNGDLDGETKPPAVQALLDAVSAADGLLFATPEYNYSLSGVLKNTIDWISRPAYKSVLRGKPTAILSASMSMMGGARAQIHLRDVLAGTLTPVFLAPEFLLATAHKAFDDSGNLADAATEARLRQYLSDYLAWVSSS